MNDPFDCSFCIMMSQSHDSRCKSFVFVSKKISYSKNNKKVMVEYVLYPEAFSDKIGGDIQKSPVPVKFEIIKKSDNELTFISPKKKGAYRLFAYVKNEKGQTSVANIPFLVD